MGMIRCEVWWWACGLAWWAGVAAWAAPGAPVTGNLGFTWDAKNTSAQVIQVASGSPAAVGKFEKGDTILAVEGANVSSVQEFTEKIARFAGGSTVKIHVKRGPQPMELRLTLPVPEAATRQTGKPGSSVKVPAGGESVPPFNGKVSREHPNGAREEMEYQEGMKVADRVYAAGKLATEMQYRQGAATASRSFHGNGGLMNEMEFREGKPVRSTSYNPEGQPVGQMQYRDGLPFEGVMVQYDAAGQKVFEHECQKGQVVRTWFAQAPQ